VPEEKSTLAPISTDDLRDSERRLVLGMREIGFGRIERLAIAHGQPQLDPWPLNASDEQHFPMRYWAGRWGFSEKTVREWFQDEYGPGILRQSNVGRRSKRDYTTMMISPSAAARVYAKHTAQELIH
jgi:hypothetical protein